MGYDACPIRTVSAGEIEQAVVGQLQSIFNSPEIIAQTYIQANRHEGDEIERLQKEKTEHELAILKLRQRISGKVSSNDTNPDDHTDISKLTNDLEEMQRNLIAISSELHILQSHRITEDDVSQSLKKLDLIWNELFPAEQQRIVKLLVEGVIVSTGGLDVRIRTDGLHSLVTELMSNNTNIER